MEDTLETWIDTIRDSEHSLLFFGGLITALLIGIGADYFIHIATGGHPLKGILSILLVFGYLGVIGLIIAKERKEEEELKAYIREEEMIAAKQDLSIYHNQLGEANKLIAELKAKAVDIERLSTAQRDLATAQRDLATAKQELSTARTELATAQDKISTQLALLSTAKQELSTATDAINKQRQLIKKLTPIQVAWEDFKAYKRYESAVKQPSLSADEREGARVKRDDYKDAWKRAIDEGV
jgi:hypothetical protein